jgi:hypothetical protein
LQIFPFSALCFIITDPGRRDSREREKKKIKKKEKKCWIGWDYLNLLTAFPSQGNRQAG